MAIPSRIFLVFLSEILCERALRPYNSEGFITQMYSNGSQRWACPNVGLERHPAQ